MLELEAIKIPITPMDLTVMEGMVVLLQMQTRREATEGTIIPIIAAPIHSMVMGGMLELRVPAAWLMAEMVVRLIRIIILQDCIVVTEVMEDT
jgi:hypothetical protein